ncbi:MAG: hypothetical protein AAF830_01575 [Pseudomonadota bacterium]
MVFAALFLLVQPLPDLTEKQSFICPPERHEVASARLQKLRDADQDDRRGAIDASLTERDNARREEVAALFAEGCLITGRDHHNAALIFQHGKVPEHYYQAYRWAQRAVALGDTDAEWLISRAIDRFLLNSGYKQLFGSNAFSTAPRVGDGFGPPTPWCLEPVVKEFTDAQREAQGFPTLQERIDRIAQMNESDGREVGEPFCDKDLADPPKGVFPGIW